MLKNPPLVLMILDGWGYSEDSTHNAIAKARTPQWDAWWQTCPHILLEASGTPVGLPDEQMGNSEVGHMHMGAGRVIQQDFTRISEAIRNGTFAKNPTINHAIDDLQSKQKALHVMGLLSPGGVHSHEEHLFALLALCHQKHFNNVFLHLFLDGRDTPPSSALGSIERLNNELTRHPVAQIASITGRYYAMDRDQRWERIAPVYRLLTQAVSDYHFDCASTAIHSFYQQNISDEFIPPTQIGYETAIQDGDGLFFFNFRADRARQLTSALIAPEFQDFQRLSHPILSHFISMTQYDKNLSTEIAFSPIPLNNTLGEVLAHAGLKQLRIAETEKYAHVTFFFNGGNEQIFTDEERILIPSPKVATYDLKPEMSAPELTRTLCHSIQNRDFDVIICNYANADMVGHSGNLPATIQAIECLDHCMRQIGETLKAQGGGLLITADHGNAEAMFDEHTHQAHTAHTNQPVPLLFVGEGWHFVKNHGTLIDIAPTLLKLLGVAPPKEMTGHALLEKDHAFS